MNKHFLTIATLGIGLAALVSAGGECRAGSPKWGWWNKRQLIKKTFPIKDFRHLEVSGRCTVIFEQTDGPPSLTVEGPKDLLKKFTVTTTDGTLCLWHTVRKGDRFPSPGDITCRVRAKSLDRVDLSCGAEFEAAEINGDDFSLKISTGKASIAWLKCNLLRVDIQLDGHVKVAGVVKKQVVAIDGRSVYDAGGLESTECSVEFGKHSSASVCITKYYSRFSGNPESVDFCPFRRFFNV